MNVYVNNRKKLLEKMADRSVLLLNSGNAPHKTTDQFYHYTPNRNFFFLTGLEEENVILMMVKGKKQFYTFLFIEETTEFMRKWYGEKVSKEEASKISGIDISKVYYLKQMDMMFRSLMTYDRGLAIEQPKSLYLDMYRVKPLVEPVSLAQFKDIINVYKELRIKNVNEHLSYLRMFKSKEEVASLSTAIKMTDEGLKRVMKELKVRKNEHEIQADFLHEITLKGSEGYSFNPIFASGENATVLHYEDNNSELKDGNLLLCDIGALHKNYGADITRTFPINGKFTERQKELYEIVLDVNKKAIKYVKPGITWKELNTYAKGVLAKQAIKIGLIKEEAEIDKYYYHSIGHFLGLDVHDVGQYDKELLEGMVLTIEPGIYIKEEGIGIRIEDNVLVTKEGSKNLSKSIIKEVKDIEEYMS